RPASSGAGAVLQDDGEDRSPARLTAMIVGAVAAALLVGVLVATQLGGDDDTPAPVSTIGAAPAPEQQGEGGSPGDDEPAATTAPVDRGDTTVSVLNGTQQTGLARAVARELEDSGFTISGTGNNADQARSATIVSFTPGNRRAAQTVADIIGVGDDAVAPIDRNTAVSAGDARVVVTVGADRIE
ncbi:MAG: LytR C-terminal domain-containing protein, partial [Solirubrobacterales bacterium]|nr:LytR C-terminal domain-containing protein [Solirubrobacterales bacterium]